MARLPPDLAAFSYLIDTQPAPVRDAFYYCLCLCLVKAGKLRLVEKFSVEGGRICVFAPCRDGETMVGKRFSVVEPKMSREQKAALIDVLREILEEEGV